MTIQLLVCSYKILTMKFEFLNIGAKAAKVTLSHVTPEMGSGLFEHFRMVSLTNFSIRYKRRGG